MNKLRLILLAILLSIFAVLPATTPVSATFAGGNGKILYVKSDNKWYTINADGSGEQEYIHNQPYFNEPRFSPDGNRISFQGNSGGLPGTQSHYMNFDGSGVRRVTDAMSGGAQWSPDGLRLTYSEPQAEPNQNFSQLVSAGLDGSNKHLIGYYMGGELSPDGNKLLSIYSDSPHAWVHYNLNLPPSDNNRVAETIYMENSNANYLSCASWSPDNVHAVLYLSVLNTSMPNPKILIVNTITGEVEKTIVTGYYRDGCPIYSPNGSSLVFVASPTEETSGTMVKMDIQTEAKTVLKNGVSKIFDWQPLNNPFLYRMANWKTHERLFTTNPEEVFHAQQVDNGWVYEGVGMKVYSTAGADRTPVYRLANWRTHERLFTTNFDEIAYAQSLDSAWIYEGIAFYASTNPRGAIVYRLANWKTKERLFTTNRDEALQVPRDDNGWVYEGVAFYAAE
jgi:hypothetical protein